MKISPPCCATCQQTFLSLGLIGCEVVAKDSHTYCSHLCSTITIKDKIHLNALKGYRDFLLSRVFDVINFPSNEALLAHINASNQVHEHGCWRDAKRAFNAIGNRCEFRSLTHSGYAISLCSVPHFIAIETAAYLANLNNS